MSYEYIKLDGDTFDKFNLNEYKSKIVFPWQEAIYSFLKEWFNNSNEISTYSSGSTGNPKLITLTKATMRNSAIKTNSFFKLNKNTTALLCLPATYIAGKMMIVRAIVGNYQLLTTEPKADPFKELDQKIDFAAITPYQLTFSLKTLSSKSIGTIIVGGGQIDSKLQASCMKLQSKIYETYGMTETASHIALRSVNHPCNKEFITLEGIKINLDERGCLVIYAPHLYPYQLITNDIVLIVEPNKFRWLGRKDNIINSGGIKLHPEQIEEKIRELITDNFFISSLRDELLGRKVVLIIESAIYGKQKIQKLNHELRKKLEKYENPKEILFMNQFVYSNTQKILKKETIKLIGKK